MRRVQQARYPRPALIMLPHDACGGWALDAVAPGAMVLEAEQHPHVHAEHRVRQRVIRRQQIAQSIRQAQHPLAHLHPGGPAVKRL